VGEDMISEAYEKHKMSLCRKSEEVLHLSEEHLQGLYEYGKRVGRRVKDLYDPFKTSLPNQMASVEAARREGGNLSALKMNGSLQSFSGHPLTHLQKDNSRTRLEPFVIGLFGPPGSGKTTLCKKLISDLGRKFFPDLPREKLLYSRNCGTKHWDGYDHQPIVILDDFGQDLLVREDLVEFETLISINDYILPMASLPQKGTKFRSPIVIVTSNMSFGGGNLVTGSNQKVVEDPIALWRRFDLPLLVMKGENGPCTRLYELELKTGCRDFWNEKFHTSNHHWTSCYPFSGNQNGVGVKLLEEELSPQELKDVISEGIEKKFSYHRKTFFDSWDQTIISKSVRFLKKPSGEWDLEVFEDPNNFSPHTRTKLISFPPHPPKHPPVVKAQAISEPLKVRMITVAECDTKVLQPLQKAMWRDLGHQPQFCLTNGVKILEDFEEETIPWIKRIEHEIQRILQESESPRENALLKKFLLSLSLNSSRNNSLLLRGKRRLFQIQSNQQSLSHILILLIHQKNSGCLVTIQQLLITSLWRPLSNLLKEYSVRSIINLLKNG
jgi:hypothetical protein